MKNALKIKVKLMIPARVKNAIKALLTDQETKFAEKLAPFEYGGKRWAIRCIISRK